jgi:hypothetical protein
VVAEFTRASLRFPLTATGKLNLYSLFAELATQLPNASGMAGIIVQSGIVTDMVNSEFFSSMLSEARIKSFYDLVNTHGIFPGIHRTHPHFCLITIGGVQSRFSASASFFNTTIDHIRDARRVFQISHENLALFNPNTRMCPAFRSVEDEKLSRKIYEICPVFINESEANQKNPWAAKIVQNLFSHTTDGSLFLEYAQPATDHASGSQEKTVVPLYEGKMVDQYDHRFGSFRGRIGERGNRVLPEVSAEEYLDPGYEPQAYYGVDERELLKRLSSKGWERDWILVWKDITTSVTDRTTKAAALPRVATDDTLTLFMPSIANVRLTVGLLGNINSILLDYISRQKVSGVHLRRNVFVQLPILPPRAYSEADLDFIVPKVLELTYTSHSMAPFARDLGHDGPPFSWNEEARALRRADLDAWYALAYGLSRGELRYVLDPNEVMGADYPSETFRVLQKNEIAKYGEYRTARLVIAAYDRLVREGLRPRTEGYR